MINAARLQPGRIISSRTLLDTAVQRDSSSGPRKLDAVISAIRLRLGRVILLLTLLHTTVQRGISAARLRLRCVVCRGLAQLQPDTDMGTCIKSTRITPRQARRVRREILVNTKLEPGPNLQANIIMTFDPGGRFHEFRGKANRCTLSGTMASLSKIFPAEFMRMGHAQKQGPGSPTAVLGRGDHSEVPAFFPKYFVTICF